MIRQQQAMNDAGKKERSVFTSQLKLFPKPVDGKICTEPFLEAAEGIVTLVETLGTVFAPVRFDINGNIQKLKTKYNEDAKSYEFLNDMILRERAQGGEIAVDALLWLRRALHFIHDFLLSVVEDEKKKHWEEDLRENVQRAYKNNLEMYHGWMAQGLFKVVSKMVPTRRQLLQTFGFGRSKTAIYRELEEFLSCLKSNLDVLSNFYEDFKLCPPKSNSS